MSDEGRVTPFDEMLDISPLRVTPEAGKGALGTWRFRDRPRLRAGSTGTLNLRTSPACKPSTGGVNMSQHLSSTVSGKAAGGQAKVRTGLGKSDRPGSQGGLWKRGLMSSRAIVLSRQPRAANGEPPGVWPWGLAALDPSHPRNQLPGIP